MIHFKCGLTGKDITKENCELCKHPLKGRAYCTEIRKVVVENLKAMGVF